MIEQHTKEANTYDEVAEVDDSLGGTGEAIGDKEDEDPGEEVEQDVGGPDTGYMNHYVFLFTSIGGAAST